MKANGIEEKKTLIINSFRKAFDYELALKTYAITDEERDEIEADEVFWMQIQQIEAKIKEYIVTELRNIADPMQNTKVSSRLDAIKELGRILYPTKFKPKQDTGDNSPSVIVYLPDNGRGANSASQGEDFSLGTVQDEDDVVITDEEEDTVDIGEEEFEYDKDE